MRAIKVGDVFDFRYKPDVLEDLEKRWYRGYSSHCFDGQLVAQMNGDELILMDTYWGSGGSKYFTPEEAREKGVLTFRFNTADVEKANEDVGKYYSREDWFNFSYQHGCYKRYVLKKGVKKIKDQMLATINEQRREAHSDLERAVRWIERLSSDRQKIESGDLGVYL